MKNCATDLAERYQMEETRGRCKIKNFGIFGEEKGKDGAARLITKTDKIKAEPGLCFGLHFLMNLSEEVSVPSPLRVTVNYPVSGGENRLPREKSVWEMAGESPDPIFLGWTFEADEPMIPGTYFFQVHDARGLLLVEKEFTVV